MAWVVSAQSANKRLAAAYV